MKDNTHLHTTIREQMEEYLYSNKEIKFIVLSKEARQDLVLELYSYGGFVSPSGDLKYNGYLIYDSEQVEYYSPVFVLKK